MTPNEFLREVAAAITRQEDLSDKEVRDVLYELALRIYALLQAQLPATNFERQLRWPRLRTELLPQLQSTSDVIRELLFNRVAATTELLRSPVGAYFDIPPNALRPRPLTEALDNTRVLATPLSELFTPSVVTGVSPFALQLLRLLERSLIPAFFKEEATKDVAAHVIATRTIAGRTSGVATRGTVASAWRERVRGITAAALWAQLVPLQRAAIAQSPTPPTLQWRWVAVLDPRTCPICRPLDGTVAAEPQLFPRGAPPLHPNCRCVVIPTSAS
jgi:hypothetical protein